MQTYFSALAYYTLLVRWRYTKQFPDFVQTIIWFFNMLQFYSVR